MRQHDVHKVAVVPLGPGLYAEGQVSEVANGTLDGGLRAVDLAVPGAVVASHAGAVADGIVKGDVVRCPFVLQNKVVTDK